MAPATIIDREHLVCSLPWHFTPLQHWRVPLLIKQGRLPLPVVQHVATVVFISVLADTETNTLSKRTGDLENQVWTNSISFTRDSLSPNLAIVIAEQMSRFASVSL